jgi:hypothetical protein
MLGRDGGRKKETNPIIVEEGAPRPSSHHATQNLIPAQKEFTGISQLFLMFYTRGVRVLAAKSPGVAESCALVPVASRQTNRHTFSPRATGKQVPQQ